MSNFLTRSITAFVFGLACIASIYFFELIHVIFLIFSVVALQEFNRIYNPNTPAHVRVQSLVLSLLSFCLISLVHLQLIIPSLVWLIPLLLAASFYVELFQKSTHPFENIAQLLLGYIYTSLPFSMFVGLGYMQGTEYSYQLPLGILFLIWANDTGAYLIGITFGKNRLFERISPKKSWEGFIGGGLFSLLFAYLISSYFQIISSSHWLVISVIVVLAGTLGDLVESMFKRSKEIKDSGTILPGHGGVLDRFDALLLVAPIVYCYLRLFL